MPKVWKAIYALIKVVYVNIIVSLSAELEVLPSSKECTPVPPPIHFTYSCIYLHYSEYAR